MKTTKIVERKYEEPDKIVCDSCKRENHGDDWRSGASTYEVLKTKIQLHTGHAWPGDYDVTIREVDLCPECFMEKLVPFLESIGAPLRESREDF